MLYRISTERAQPCYFTGSELLPVIFAAICCAYCSFQSIWVIAMGAFHGNLCDNPSRNTSETRLLSGVSFIDRRADFSHQPACLTLGRRERFINAVKFKFKARIE